MNLTTTAWKNLSFFLTWIALAIFTGCSVMGIPTADTFNAKLAVAYSSVTTIRLSAVTLLDSQKISAADGQNILDQTNHARTGLDIARQLSITDLKAADGKLTAIRTVLDALKTYLDQKGIP